MNDFIYLDPPYVPENKSSFVNYNEDGFNKEEHEKLFINIKKLKNMKFLLSNSNCDIIKEEFKNYNIKEINCKRRINSKNPNSTTIELLISNFTPLEI